MLSEVHRTEKDQCCVTPLTCGSLKTQQTSEHNRITSSLTGIENTPWLSVGVGAWGVRSTGCEIGCRDVLAQHEKQSQYFVVIDNGARPLQII